MSTLKLQETLFELPSRGICYDPEKVPLLNSTSVVIAPFTWGDIRNMAANGNDVYKLYMYFMHKVVRDSKKIDFDDMLVADVNAILYAVRILSFGPKYGFNIVCANCEERVKKSLSLLDAEVVDVESMDDFKADGLEIELGGKKVVYHLPRLKDEKKVGLTFKRLRGEEVIVGTPVDRTDVGMSQYIDTIDGQKLTSDDKFQFVSSMPIPEGNKFTRELAKRNIGVQTTQRLECPHCEFENEVSIGMGREFFRVAEESEG